MKNYRLKCLLVVIFLADDHAFAQDDSMIGIGKVFYTENPRRNDSLL